MKWHTLKIGEIDALAHDRADTFRIKTDVFSQNYWMLASDLELIAPSGSGVTPFLYPPAWPTAEANGVSQAEQSEACTCRCLSLLNGHENGCTWGKK